MKTLQQLCAAVLCGALLASGAPAFAQAYNHGNRQHDASAQQHQRPVKKQHRGMYQQGRQQGWYKQGGRLPRAYWGKQYVVSNWRAYRLRPPPRGYHWVRSNNGDYLLVAVTTGVIASIVTAALQH